MTHLATCFRAILAAISPLAAAERARAAALLLFWNHLARSLDQLDHLFTLWRTNTLPPQCGPIAPHPTAPPAPTPAHTRSPHPRQTARARVPGGLRRPAICSASSSPYYRADPRPPSGEAHINSHQAHPPTSPVTPPPTQKFSPA